MNDDKMRDEDGFLIEAEICCKCFVCDRFEECLEEDAFRYCRIHNENCNNCVTDCEVF